MTVGKTDSDIVNFFFELGALKRTKRSGWQHLGIPNQETIADHTCRTAMIAFVLAQLEGANPDRAALMALFHELGETRIGDLDKLAQRYLTQKEEVELSAVDEQLTALPSPLAIAIRKHYDAQGKDESPEAIVCKDADYLECFLQAKEYLDAGYTGAQNWLLNAERMLKTKSAKRLAALALQTRSTAWFEGLKRIER